MQDNIMAININNLGNNSQVHNNLKQQAEVKNQANQQAGKAAQAQNLGKDSVSITPQAKQMSELQKKANEAPVIDQKKVEELKKAIASGEYKIDPEKLAASIANFEFKLV